MGVLNLILVYMLAPSLEISQFKQCRRHYLKCPAELEVTSITRTARSRSHPMTEEEAFLYDDYTENFIK